MTVQSSELKLIDITVPLLVPQQKLQPITWPSWLLKSGDEQHDSRGRSPPAEGITKYLCVPGRWRDEQQKHMGKQVCL